MGGWLDSDNKAISVQLNLTGTELGNNDNSKFGWVYFLLGILSG